MNQPADTVGSVAEPVDLQGAADRLGVHYQTAYRWVRSGKLPASLVSGRYQVDPRALTRFAQSRSEPRAPRPRRPRQGFGPLSDQCYEHLVSGDERAVQATIGRLVEDGVAVATIATAILVPALRRVGQEWRDGALGIAEEHRASAIVERVLADHQPRPRGRRRGVAVVAALSGDRHNLPTLMAATALREDNWHVHHLGADLPSEELLRFCRDHQVDLAVLTVTSPDTAGAARRAASLLRRDGVRTLVGEPGATLEDLQRDARRR